MIKSEDVKNIGFRTRFGHYDFLLLPFGLMNAPATSQQIMNELFRPYLGKFVVVFLDNILIYGKTFEEHIDHIRTFLTKLCDQELLYAKESKCEFLKRELVYLGHKITANEIMIDESKIKIVVDWSIPKTVRQVESFLGFNVFFRRFVNEYAKIAAPLNNLTKGVVNKMEKRNQPSPSIV